MGSVDIRSLKAQGAAMSTGLSSRTSSQLTNSDVGVTVMSVTATETAKDTASTAVDKSATAAADTDDGPGMVNAAEADDAADVLSKGRGVLGSRSGGSFPGRSGSGSLITSVYPDVQASWQIASRVIDGMRPTFSAPAVPGPYIALAQRCWDAEPAKRPSFEEIVKLLEAVLNGDSDAAGDAKGGSDVCGEF